MPIYEYVCGECQKKFSQLRPMSKADLPAACACGSSNTTRAISMFSAISRGGKTAIAAMDDAERARTGISSLKIRYNRVFGYYLEISKANLHLVPGDYIRRQTLANGERYVTEKLKEYDQD